MKKASLKRLGIGLLQHILAAGIMAVVAMILLNSYITVNSIDGTMVYRIFPMDADQEFEESDIYHDLFRNAVSDITQLVVVKEQMESNDVFDPHKKINVTEYARQIGEDQDCAVSVVYELEDIIKWGKYGVEHTNRMMSMSEFVNYFGYCIYPENFILDEYGKLAFDGFHRIEEISDDQQDDSRHDKETTLLLEKFSEYTQEQLEDLVFSYIMTQNLSNVSVNREDDGSLVVSVPMLNCRYNTIDGERQLTSYVNNWVDYIRLQDNVMATINGFTASYQRYQICNEAYKAERSNVKYMVRMMTDDGMSTYTNVSQIKDLSDNEVTEYFSEYRRYLIYYPDSLVFMGYTILNEEEIDDYIGLYNYAYPDTTHIWLCVDTDYAVEGDAFYMANAVYQKIVPNTNRIISLIALLAAAWVGIGLYMTITTGMIIGSNGQQHWHLNRFDRIWSESLIILCGCFLYGGVLGYRLIMKIAENGNVLSLEMLGIQLVGLYRYGVFALYGVYVTAAFQIIWYSVVRRIRANYLWKGSFLHYVCKGISNTVSYVLQHRNSVISMLLPYNLFLFSNLIGIVMVYILLNQHKIYAILIMIAMVVLDVSVGMFLFRRNAEQIEISDGIKKIRDGEVEYKIELDKLHGSGRELADAVNNIGEGIRKAVRTSMKDEQMKTDLITNVSHDIKTPLTSIINYVDLLKRLKIQEEPAKGYIAILDSKAQRLKQLTDDLVEVSKISSGTIVFNREKLNLAELLNQSIGEFSEKLEECRLQVIYENHETPAYIYADSSRMWRVIENLFNNICKYALEGTRVYIQMEKQDKKVEVSVKNISKEQMHVRTDDLTERFIRGDSARTTEGSGLGLSIAKSLVQAQGGSFEILLDGDLFKTIISFPEYSETMQERQAT